MNKTQSNEKERERVRKALSEALFDLLLEKSFSEITVSDIIRRAGVARASYYRNFRSKEDILENALDVIGRKAAENVRIPEHTGGLTEEMVRDLLESLFTIYLGVKTYILMLCRTGFSGLLVRSMSEYAEQLLGSMPASSIDRYRIYYYAGGIFNVMVVWLADGARESPHAVASYCARLIFRPASAGGSGRLP